MTELNRADRRGRLTPLSLAHPPGLAMLPRPDHRLVMLSFDVEEFDLPVERGQALPLRKQMAMGAAGLDPVLALLERHQLSATFFVTVRFAEHYPSLVRHLSDKHEVGSHSYDHGRFNLLDVWRSRDRLQQITGAPINAFRRPRLAETNRHVIEAAGYRYNSSNNPTWIPGRYNHLSRPRRPHQTGRLVHLPISTTPITRFPLFWLSFKALPEPVLARLLQRTLAMDGLLTLFFHPWEFLELNGYRVPRLVRRCDGVKMLRGVEAQLRWLKREARFIPISDFERYLPR
jgi:peptidoglycan/xylan/chitin deacetylase (PgdA/CDA1 family)